MGRAINPPLDTAWEADVFIGLAVSPSPPCWAGAALRVVHPGVPYNQEDAGISKNGRIRRLGVDGTGAAALKL